MAEGSVKSYYVELTGSADGLVKAAGEGEAAGASLESRMGSVSTSMAGVGAASKTHIGGTAVEQSSLLEKGVGKIDSAIKSTIGSVVSMGAQFAGLAAIGGGMAAIGAGVKDAVDFQQQLTLIQTQAGDTTDNLKALGNSFEALGPKVGQTPENLAQAFFHLASAGYTGQQALDMLTQSSELADVGQSDLETTTNLLVAAMKSGVPGINDAAGAVGTLNAIVGSGNMRMQDLVDAMGSGILPVAGTFGVSIQSVGAALSFMTDQGVPAADAATKLRMSLSLLAAPSAQATKLLTDAGLAASDAADQTSAMQQAFEAAHVTTTQMAADLQQPDGLVVALTDLKNHMDAAGVSAQEQDAVISRAFGGGRSGAAIIDMYNNLSGVKGKFDEINTSAGNFPKDWAQQQKTGAQALADVKSAADVAVTALGTGLLPYIEQLGQWVAAHSGDIENFGKVVGEDLGNAAHAAGQFISQDLFPAIKNVGDFIGSHIDLVRDFAEAIGALYVAHKGISLVGGLANDVQKLVGSLGGGAGAATGAGIPVYVTNWGGVPGVAGAAGDMTTEGNTWGVAAAGTLKSLLPAAALVFAGEIVSDLNLRIDDVHWPPNPKDVDQGVHTGNLAQATGIPTAPGGPASPWAYGINRDTILNALGIPNTPVITDQQKQTATADMQMIDDLLGRGVNDMQGLAAAAVGLNTYMNKYGALASSDVNAFADLWADGVTNTQSIHSDIDLLHSYTAKYGPLSSNDLATFSQLVANGKTDVDDIHKNLLGAPGNASDLTTNLGTAAHSAQQLTDEINAIKPQLPSSDFGNLGATVSHATGGTVAAAATGGMQSGLRLVGEHGPELVTFDTTTHPYVHPNFGGVGFGQMGDVGGAAVGGDMHFHGDIHIHGVDDPAAFFEAVQKEALRRHFNQGQPLFGRNIVPMGR